MDNVDKVESCFSNKLKNFYVSAEMKKVNDKVKWLISLESKRNYLINGVLKSIELKFLI